MQFLVFVKCSCAILMIRYCGGPFWLNRDGLPPAVLDPNILSKGVEIDPMATQFNPDCAQTMPCLQGEHLRRAELFQTNCGRQI